MMKRLLVPSLFGLASLAISPLPASANVPVVVQLQTTNDTDGKGTASELYLNATFPINYRYTISPEFANIITYRAKGQTKLGLTHEFLRLTVKDNALMPLSGDWKVGMGYRYSAPTDLGSQRSGNLGVLAFRPELTGKSGDVSFLFREILNFPLNRSPHKVSVNPSPDRTDKDDKSGQVTGNSLFQEAVEIQIGYDIAAGFSVGTNLAPVFTLVGPAAGSTGNTWKKEFNYALEVGYSDPKVLPVDLTIGYEKTKIPMTSDFTLLGDADYYLTIQKIF